MIKFFSIFLALLIHYPFFAQAAEPLGPEQQASFVKSEDVVGKKIGEYRLVDQDGREFGKQGQRPFNALMNKVLTAF